MTSFSVQELHMNNKERVTIENMRIPKRRSQELKTVYDEEPVLLTPDGLKRLKTERERLDKVERPQAVQDVYEARQKGDLSENAEYQEARSKSFLVYRVGYLISTKN